MEKGEGEAYSGIQARFIVPLKCIEYGVYRDLMEVPNNGPQYRPKNDRILMMGTPYGNPISKKEPSMPHLQGWTVL